MGALMLAVLLQASEPAAGSREDALEQRNREMMRHVDEPHSLAERWDRGGSGMYLVALALVFGLFCGGAGLALAFSEETSRAAAAAASLAFAGGTFAVAIGWACYASAVADTRHLLSHVEPRDREVILLLGKSEASELWKFGSVAGGLDCLVGGAGLALALRRRRPLRES